VSDARMILRELVAARASHSLDAAEALLGADVRYWDCEHGEVRGRDGVARVLTTGHEAAELETIAAQGDDAVLEVQLQSGTRRRRSTEVYRLEGGAITAIKAYIDPAQRD
jgi:SnoaL-like domain